MPKFSFLCIVIAMFGISFGSCEDASYDKKYDNIDIDEILNSERLLSNYIKCLLEEGPCTEDGRELKDTLPDAIETDCSKCTEKQKCGSEKIMHFIIDNRPDDWTQLEQMYDKSGKYRMDYIKSKSDSNENNQDNENSSKNNN